MSPGWCIKLRGSKLHVPLTSLNSGIVSSLARLLTEYVVDCTVEPFGAGLNSQFSYIHSTEDDASFSLVTGAITKTRVGGRGGGGGRGRGQGSTRGGNVGRVGQRGGFGARSGGKRNWDFKPQLLRDASVKVGAEWKIRDEYDFPRLNKIVYDPAGKVLPGDSVGSVEDEGAYGTVFYYDKQTFDRVSVKNPKTM
ncbi:hypothetical protein HDU93_005113, partial [Gonapodya sp. JEL0774]